MKSIKFDNNTKTITAYNDDEFIFSICDYSEVQEDTLSHSDYGSYYGLTWSAIDNHIGHNYNKNYNSYSDLYRHEAVNNYREFIEQLNIDEELVYEIAGECYAEQSGNYQAKLEAMSDEELKAEYEELRNDEDEDIIDTLINEREYVLDILSEHYDECCIGEVSCFHIIEDIIAGAYVRVLNGHLNAQEEFINEAIKKEAVMSEAEANTVVGKWVKRVSAESDISEVEALELMISERIGQDIDIWAFKPVDDEECRHDDKTGEYFGKVIIWGRVYACWEDEYAEAECVLWGVDDCIAEEWNNEDIAEHFADNIAAHTKASFIETYGDDI